MSGTIPWRDAMMDEHFYQRIDSGIRFAVRVLHAHGFDTCQSCQGGKGHAYEWPTIDLSGGRSADAEGFGALRPLVAYGLGPMALSIVWDLDTSGLPYQRIWRIQFRTAAPDRADQKPMFVHGYRATKA